MKSHRKWIRSTGTRRDFLRAVLALSGGVLAAGCGRAAQPALKTPPPGPGPTPTQPVPSGPGPRPTPTPPSEPSIYLDPSRPIAERVDDLVGRMTLEEKVAQMGNEATPIQRLGVPQYNWWNEALHGVARAGIATVFPQAIGLAATWNTDLMGQIASVISDEGRAKHHEAVRRNSGGASMLYEGLTFWSPNINIFRDPRWGRGQETYGEDPYLTARLAVSFIRGLQGDDPHYFKTIATAKHYAVHSGPENLRHSFDAQVSQRDLRMTYLPAFKACMTEAKAYSIMGAYNRVNGEASCASPTLLQKILREEWGFEGYVVSDCGAIDDIFSNHRLVKSKEEAAALAVKNGCDLECGCTYNIPCDYSGLGRAVGWGLLTEADIDRSVKRLFTARFRLGMFDPPEQVSYAQIPYSVVDSPEHRALALEAARQSLVLLKNEGGLLPLNKDTLTSIAVVGPNANETLVLTGNYMGTPAAPVTVRAGIEELVSPQANVLFAQGSEITGGGESGYAAAIEAAKKAQVVVFVGGLSQQVEGEQGQMEGNPPGIRSLGDRDSLDLPAVQQKLLERLVATGKPVILVLLGGSAVAVNWAQAHVPAILEAWYPGQAGGTAVAEALFGLTNPGGRLPVTFYQSAADLPPFEDYNMANRTYRYFTGQPLYHFGFGLSYTTFAYSGLSISPEPAQPGSSVTVRVTIENTGQRAGDEVAQLYLTDVEASLPVPLRALQGFQRVRLDPGQKQELTFTLTPEQMGFADEAGNWITEPGAFRVWVGGQQPGPGANGLEGQFELKS